MPGRSGTRYLKWYKQKRKRGAVIASDDIELIGIRSRNTAVAIITNLSISNP
jgi:hypothetical protein